MSASATDFAASLSPTDVDSFVAALSDDEVAVFAYDWSFWGRPEQQAPEGDWRGWLILTGRGWGKTRTGAEWAIDPTGDGTGPQPEDRIALVGATAADVRDVMVEGESGILAIAPPWNRPTYESSKRRLTWKNGAMATTYSADEPDRLRGPQHSRAWADEVASWRYGPETWANLMFGLRIGPARWVATTTPRPVRLVRDLMALDGVAITRGTIYDNRPNLAEPFFNEIISKYEGTRIGRQELEGELLDDVPGALWSRALVESSRAPEPDMIRIVVAIDPALTSGEDADETGIIVAGKGVDGLAYVLEDASCRLSPDGWARRAVNLYHKHKADRVIAETNNGGEMVELTVRTVDSGVSYRAVHASRGKRTRAEPVAALYEQGKVKHVKPLPELEDQMCGFVPDLTDGPDDRVDALVWALTELMLTRRGVMIGTVG